MEALLRYVMIFLLIAGCSSASLSYRGVDPVRVTVDGSTWDVYRSGDNVQAIRVNFEMLPEVGRMVGRAITAIERATGCGVVANSASGDQALVNARIDCE